VNVLEVPRLRASEAEMFCKAWLSQSHRVLSTELLTTLLLSWAVDCSVLMLWLLFHVSRQWRSFQRAPLEIIGLSLAQIIETLVLEPLEKTHGVVLLSRTFGLLCCALHGLSCEELMDLLSCDETVLVHTRSSTESHTWSRIGGAVWLRLIADVRPLCAASGALNGFSELLSVRHRSVAQAMRARYLKGRDQVEATHRALAEYFSGTWCRSGLALGCSAVSKSGIDLLRRGLAPHGNVLCEQAQPVLYNYRKFEELSHHMVRAKVITLRIMRVAQPFDCIGLV
jgi:hypothetical protein